MSTVLYFKVIPCKIKQGKFLYHIFERKAGNTRGKRVDQSVQRYDSSIEASSAAVSAIHQRASNKG